MRPEDEDEPKIKTERVSKLDEDRGHEKKEGRRSDDAFQPRKSAPRRSAPRKPREDRD